LFHFLRRGVGVHRLDGGHPSVPQLRLLRPVRIKHLKFQHVLCVGILLPALFIVLVRGPPNGRVFPRLLQQFKNQTGHVRILGSAVRIVLFGTCEVSLRSELDRVDRGTDVLEPDILLPETVRWCLRGPLFCAIKVPFSAGVLREPFNLCQCADSPLLVGERIDCILGPEGRRLRARKDPCLRQPSGLQPDPEHLFLVLFLQHLHLQIRSRVVSLCVGSVRWYARSAGQCNVRWAPVFSQCQSENLARCKYLRLVVVHERPS
jgi:hypothetical protein